MTIHVTVSTRNGDPVEGLTKDDFTLTDNKHPEPITSFQALTGTQTGVVIVLDTVNLPYSEVSFARQQLAQFFSSNPHLPQPVALGVLREQRSQDATRVHHRWQRAALQLDGYSIGLRELPRSTGIYGAEERLQLSLSTFNGLVAQLPKRGHEAHHLDLARMALVERAGSSAEHLATRSALQQHRRESPPSSAAPISSSTL